MPIRVTTQKQMNDIRHAQQACYLCSHPLPSKDQVGRRQLLVKEHVIPSSLLGPPPARGAWPVVLWIHKDCEVAHKQWRDRMIKVLQGLGSTSPQDWKREDASFFRSRFGLKRLSLSRGRRSPVITGVMPVLEGVHAWTRGLYTALYGDVLPAAVHELTHPPVPFATVRHGQTLQQSQRLRATITDQLLGSMSNVITRGNDDRLVAWGGAVNFHCVWLEDVNASLDRWICVWCLSLPGALEWAEHTTGIARPWHGVLGLPTRPHNASVVSFDELRQFRRQIELRKRYGLA